MVTGKGNYMMDYSDQLIQRARKCPFACFLKILFLLLFAIALEIAVFFQQSMSNHEYAGFVIAIGYIAILALVTNRNCRLKIR